MTKKWQEKEPQNPVVPTPQSGQQLTVEQAMATATQLHGQGKLRDAEIMLNKILSFQPNFGPALNLLGVIAHQVGKVDIAIELVEKAIKANPKEALFYSNCGEMCRMNGRLKEAISYGKKAIKLEPRMTGAQCNLGIAYFDQENYDKAETHQKKALTLDPNFLPALNNRGSIFRERKNYEEAVVWYKKALDLNPDYLESLNNIGATLTDDNKGEEALSYLKHVCELKPDYAEAQNNLGRAYLQVDNFDEALPAFEKTIKCDPNHCSGHMGIASVWREKQNYEIALQAAQRGIELDPKRAEAHSLLGRIHLDLGDETKARARYDHALELNPNHGSAHNALGSLLLEQGKLEEAEASFRTGMSLETDQGENLESLFNLAFAIKIKKDSPEHIGLVEAEKRMADFSERKLMLLHFALGKMCDDFEEYGTAFDHYLKACEMKRATFDYSAEDMTKVYKQTQSIFTPELIEKLKPYADHSAKPIFVLGSPRSGTTLTEQIIASHPDVFGAGELPDFSKALSSLPNVQSQEVFPKVIAELSAEQLVHIGKEYIKRITEHSPNSPRVTDKMPSNYFYLGLIHALLPNAKIVHVNRNPLDTCISCFSRIFAHNQYQSYNLSELGAYYREYIKLMDYWRKILPKGAFYDITYEELVNDPEGQAKALIAFCGLEWDEECLNFHRNKRSVRTASVTQVRKPIYKSSMEKWRRYSGKLDPLIEALGDVAPHTK